MDYTAWESDSDNSDNSENSDNSDSEETVTNNKPLPDIDHDFRKNVLDIKHILYTTIVLSPELGSPTIHSNELLDTYLNTLNNVYIMALRAENGTNITEKELAFFPEESREAIRGMLGWMVEFFNKNHISETIPYSEYIRTRFRDNPLVQTNSF